MNIAMLSCSKSNRTVSSNNSETISENTIKQISNEDKEIVESRTTEWKMYGEVTALCFPEFDWLACIGDGLKYENISKKFYELEDEGGYLLKPINVSILIYFRYIDGEKQYRMYNDNPKRGGYVNFSLNPHTTIEYVIDNNNYPKIKEIDVSNYSHFLEVDETLYFIKMN